MAKPAEPPVAATPVSPAPAPAAAPAKETPAAPDDADDEPAAPNIPVRRLPIASSERDEIKNDPAVKKVVTLFEGQVLGMARTELPDLAASDDDEN